jgi:hypothetical protein
VSIAPPRKNPIVHSSAFKNYSIHVLICSGAKYRFCPDKTKKRGREAWLLHGRALRGLNIQKGANVSTEQVAAATPEPLDGSPAEASAEASAPVAVGASASHQKPIKTFEANHQQIEENNATFEQGSL